MGWREDVSLATRLAHLYGKCERSEDMPESCMGCGGCCGRVLPIDMEDKRRIERYATRHHLEPMAGNANDTDIATQSCGWLDPDSKLCRIYPARPKVCRCWGSPHDGELIGTKPGQPCGLRMDMLDVWGRLGRLGFYDTWESTWEPLS